MKTIGVPHFLPVAILLCWLSAGPGFSATFSVKPSADTFVTTGPSGNLSANNCGGAGALSIAPPGLAQGEFQSVLQINLLPEFVRLRWLVATQV